MAKKIAWEQHRDNITNVNHTNSQKTVNNGQTVTRDALGRVITLDQPRTDRDHTSKTYHTNNLNQYTEITDNSPAPFTPVHDQEGNQTLVRTNTGDWQVTTPATPVLLHTLYWDPTEPSATRPLIMIRPEDGDRNWYEYTHTLNKNVSHLIDKTGSIVAHYDYDAYGNLTEQTGILADVNPIRFSSEYHDDGLGLVYYNYRHYNPNDGRWINRDPISESGGINLYGFVGNNVINLWDVLGKSSSRSEIKKGIEEARSLLTQVKKCYKNGSSKCCEDMYNDYVSRLSQLIKDSGEFYQDLWWISDEDQKVMQELYGLPASMDGASLSEEQLAALSNSTQTAGESIDNNIFNRYGTEIENGATFVAGFSDGATLGMAEHISKLAFGSDAQWADPNNGWYVGGYWTGVAATTAIGVTSYLRGREIAASSGNWRIAPYGNRTGNKFGELPHYHRRVYKQNSRKVLDGQGIKRHRPWDVKNTDKSFWDRF